MKAKIKIEKEVELKTLLARVRPSYWEDATVNGVEDTNGDLIPLRQGDLWCPIIDIDSGVLVDWTEGVTASIHYRVCDAGSYYLLDKEGNHILSIEEDYVPAMMCPEGEGYGDYIIMEIDEKGKIANWQANLSGFIE